MQGVPKKQYEWDKSPVSIAFLEDNTADRDFMCLALTTYFQCRLVA